MNLTQEHKLLNYLNEIYANPTGYIAVHVRLSRISAVNRTVQKMKVAISILEKALNYAGSAIFVLGNSDIVVISKGSPLRGVYNAVEEVKKLFAKDIAVINSYDNSFSKIYSFDHQFAEFDNDIRNVIDSISSSASHISSSNPPLTPESLDTVMMKMEGVNIGKAIKKQEVISIEAGNIGRIFFEEYYISLRDLKQILGVDVNLVSDRWLFKHFSESLDRKMLITLAALGISYNSDISLNLNLASIDTPEFRTFLAGYRRTLVVELQVADIFENIKGYEEAKSMLHGKGHKIVIDMVDDEMLDLLDLSLLFPDYIKVMWKDGYLQNGGDIQKLRGIVEKIGSDRIVLCRCSDEGALRWGLERKISMYQGYFIDDIIGAMIKKQCFDIKDCRVKDCISRRHFVDPRMKEGCGSIDHLDKNPEVKIGGDK